MSAEEIVITPVEDSAARTRSRGVVWGATFLLFRRRLMRDVWLAAASTAIIATAVMLAFAGPALVSRTIDEGTKDAVNSAGPAADIRIKVPVGNSTSVTFGELSGVDPAEFDSLAQQAAGYLPDSVAAQVSDTTQWVASPAFALRWVETADAIAEAEAASDTDEVVAPERTSRNGDLIQFGFSTDAGVTLVDGALPTAPQAPAPDPEVSLGGGGFAIEEVDESPVEVAVSAPLAELLELGIGDQFDVASPVGENAILKITGIVAEADPTAAVWEQFPDFGTPVLYDNPALPLLRRGTIIVDDAALDAITTRLSTPFSGTIKMDVVADGLTLETGQQVARDMRALDPGELFPEADVSVSLESSLAAALESYPQRARAAMAQMSVVVAGVIAVAAVVIALVARLLVSRREHDIALERARGASVSSTGLRLLMESVLLTAVGYSAGYYGTVALVGDVDPENVAARLVALVSAVAAPALGIVLARKMWAGTREPANRQDRAKLRKAKAARRATLEALAVVVGVIAVITLRGRGVLQTSTSGIDPFLAAAPVLLALAIVVIVLRLYPIPMAVIQFLAKRTRGVAGIITLAKARERIPVLPLLAVTLAIAVAVSSGLIVATVQGGQEQASWERVGGEVRIDAEVDPVAIQQLRDQGLTVSANYVKPLTNLAIDDSYIDVSSLTEDVYYADILDASGLVDTTSLRQLQEAAASRGPGDPIPALASQEVLDVVFDQEVSVYMGRTYLPVEFIGEAIVTPDGWAEGPFVLMPASLVLAAEVDTPFAPNLVFVSGEGAEEAVAALPSITPDTVSTREGWLDATRDSALIGGVERLMALSVIVVGLLAAIALLVTIMQGVRARGRALSMLRTQGMGSGWGWWLALAELAPLTFAAVVGGATAGLAIMVLVGGALGLEVLAGGVAPPEIQADPLLLGAVGVGVVVLLLFAVAAEVIAHRSNKLSEVLRYGESR